MATPTVIMFVATGLILLVAIGGYLVVILTEPQAERPESDVASIDNTAPIVTAGSAGASRSRFRGSFAIPGDESVVPAHKRD